MELSADESGGDSDTEKIQCSFCPRKYLRVRSYREHIRKKHREKLYQEEAAAPVRKSLESTESGEGEEFWCSICLQNCKTLYAYNMHWTKYHQKLPDEDVAKEENKASIEKSRVSSLKREPKVEVSTCVKTVEGTDNSEAPECPICQHKFSSTSNVRRHLKEVHRWSGMYPRRRSQWKFPQGMPLVDSECEDSMTESDDEHIVERVHCPSCSRSYKNKKTWLSHWNKKHVIKPSPKDATLCEKPGSDLMADDETTDEEEDESYTDDQFCSACLNSSSLNCRFCDQTLDNFGTLKKHYMDFHKSMLQSCASNPVTASGDSANCLHCDRPCDSGDGSVQTGALEKKGAKTQLPAKSPLIVNCEADTGMAAICNCGLIYLSERNIKKHLEKKKDYHPDTTYTTISVEEARKIKTSECSFCYSVFRGPFHHKGLRKHLNEVHYEKKSNAAHGKKSVHSIGGSVTDSEYSAGKGNKKQKRKSDPGGSYSAKSSSAPVESSQSSLAYLDLHTPTNQMSKNTTVSDENIVTEVLTNSGGRKGPIRLLNAASPKKSIQHFQNVSITVNADTSNDVRVVSKTTENKVKKYSNSRISLNSAFVFKSTVDQMQDKTDQAGPSSRDENREVRPAIVSTNSGDHVRPGVITCDKDKVKAVSVGVDNDTSSEGEKSPPQNRDAEQVTFNVPSYLSNSPSKYSPFVKLMKVDEADPKEPQRQLSKYVSSKYSSKSVFGRGKSYKSKNVRFGSPSGQEEQTLASSSALSPTVLSGQHVSVLHPSLGAQQSAVPELSSSQSSLKSLFSTTEGVRNVMAVTVAKPVNNVESTPTSIANENSQRSANDGENFKKSSAEEKEMTSPKKSSSKQQSPKKSSPRKRAFALRKLLTENFTEKQFLPNTDVSSPRASQISKQVLRSGKTVKKSVEQGGISRKKKATSQPYLKRNTAISKIHAIKAKLSLRKRRPSEEIERKSARLKNKQDDQESQDLGANNEVVEEHGSGSERELEEDATLKINKTPTQKEGKKTPESSPNGKTAKKQEAHIDKDLEERSSFVQHETEEERVLKIENLKQKTSLLLHELDEMIHVPLQTQTKNVPANDQDENQAEVHMEVQTEMAQSSSMNTKKKKKFKLRILNSRSKLKKGKTRKVSREEVPITPERNIEDSIHFPQLPAISKERKGGMRTSSRIKPPETVSLDLSPRIVAIPSPTTGVVENEASTTGVLESVTTVAGAVENESTTIEVGERETSTTGVMETESTTTGVVEAESTSTGVVEIESTSLGQTSGEVNENEHIGAESGKNNIPSRRTRSWSPSKTRTAAAQDQLPLNVDLVAKTSKTPSEGSKKKAKLPNVSSEEGVTCSQKALEGKLRVENRLVGSKMPIVKLNKLEDEVDGKYMKLVWDSIGAPPQSAENVCTERSEKRRTSRPITSRRRSLSADSVLAGNDESRTPVITSQDTEEPSKNTGDGDREGLFKCLGLKQNLKPMLESKEIASIVSESAENRVSVEEIEQTMEEEVEPGRQSQSDKDEGEVQETAEQDEASTDQAVQNTEVIVHQDNEIIAAISENKEKSDEVESLENQKEDLSTEMLENVNVNRALVDRTDNVNNQSQILFVHENKVIYADSANVVPVNKDELSSLRDQVSEKRSERKKARKRKALEEDEIDGNVLPLVQPKKDVLLPETLSVCKDVVPKNTSVKPLKALEVKAVNDDEIVSSTIVEGNFGKQDLLASMITLMECAEDPDREAPSIQVTEPSFLIKKEEKIKYPCHKCDINFCQKSNLKRHKATCHPEDEFRSFDIDKKSKEVESIPLEEEVMAGEVEIFDIHNTGQGADVFGGMTGSDEEDTMYSLPLSLIRESISRLTGYNVDAHLVLQRLKLQEIIQIGDMTLKRIHKHTWRIMRKKHLPDSSAAVVEKEEHSQNQNEGPGELTEEITVVNEEDARNRPGATSENCVTNIGAISEQVSSGEKSSSWTIHHKETSSSTSLNKVEHKKSRGEHHEIPKDNTKSSKSKRINKKHVSVNKDTQAKLKIKLKSNVAAAPLTDFERAIIEPKKKHKKLKRKHSAADSEKEQGRIDDEEVGKSPHSKVTDTHQKKQRDQEDKEKPREIGAVVPKSKIVQKILRDKAREEELERMKLVPTVEEPLPSFAEILQQKPKPVEVKTEKNGQEKEQSRCENDELVINEDEPEQWNESPEEGNESPRDLSSNSSSGTGSKIPPYKSGSKSKVAKDKTEREEVLAAIQGRSIVPSAKPFRIPKTTAAEIDTLTKWKSPLQDIGHVEKFCFGAKPDGSTNKLKSRVGYSMGMTGSGQISVATSRKESVGNQYVEEIYNAIMSSSMKSPPIVEKSSGVLSLPLKNYRAEEPSTSTGIKRAADFEEDPVFKRPRVEASSVREEDMMTPDSTTPDRYLEEEQARSDTGTSPAEEAVVSDMNTEDQNPPVVSSNVSSTGESDVWNENEEANQSEKVGLEKRGIPKYTSTPLKPNIPISAKKQSHIPDNVKTFSSDINCSKPELLNDPQKKIEISNNRTKDKNTDDKTKDNEEDSIEVLESEPLDDQMEVDGVTEEEKGRQCEDNTEDVVELGDDKKEDMIVIEDREEDEEEKEDQSEEEDNEEEKEDQSEAEEEEKSEKSGSEDSESSEESDQESENEEESRGNQTKHTTIETDVDVLDVLASDEESWLDEEEEESRSRKSEGKEEDKWDDRPGEEDGSTEEGEDKEEDGEKEDDNTCIMEVEMEDEVPSTQSREGGKSGAENVYVTESTVECEDIDFQRNTIMADLIPKGFCFQFIQSNVCKKPMCMFRHEVPSKDELFKKGILEIANYHNMGNKARAYDVYKTLLDLKLQDMIPTKHIIMLLNLAEEDCDMNMALDLLRHVEKIKSIEFHEMLISMCSLSPGHYEKEMWKLFSCVQNLDKYLAGHNIVVVLRAFQEKQHWLKLWKVMNYSLCRPGFSPPVYITQSALGAVLETPDTCIPEASQWIENCDKEQLYNQDMELLVKVADIFIQHHHLKAANIVRTVAQKTQSVLIESNKGERDSDTSSVHSDAKSPIPEVDKEEQKSNDNRIQVSISGASMTRNWEYLAHLFLELCDTDKGKDPRYIRTFVEGLTLDKKNPNTLVDAFKSFMENVNNMFIKEKAEDAMFSINKSALAIIGAELLHFCAMSQWWREGLAVIQILQKNNIQYLTRKSPEGALMSTIALDVCLRCKKPYQAVQLLTACNWSFVDGLKLEKPDFKERVILLYNIVKLFTGMKRPAMALMMICKVLQKAQRDQQVEFYNSLIGFGENFHLVINQCLDIGDPQRAYAAFEVFKNGCTGESIDPGMLRRLVTVCGECRYLDPGAHNVYNYLTAQSVYPPQNIPPEPRALSIDLAEHMSLMECVLLIEDFMLYLYSFLCEWCVLHQTCVVPEEYLNVSVRFLNKDLAHTKMEKRLKMLRNLLETNLTPGLKAFIRRRRPAEDSVVQVCSPSLFQYILALDKGERGKRQGFKRGPVGVPKSGPWSRHTLI